MSGELQCEVRLGRDTQFKRAVGIVAPAPLGLLLPEDVAGGLADALVPLPAEEGHEQDPFRFKDGIALQFADPVAVGRLPAQEAAHGPFDTGL